MQDPIEAWRELAQIDAQLEQLERRSIGYVVEHVAAARKELDAARGIVADRHMRATEEREKADAEEAEATFARQVERTHGGKAKDAFEREVERSK